MGEATMKLYKIMNGKLRVSREKLIFHIEQGTQN